ncbi:MAG: hypothetical protein L3J13_03470 [Devosiaceae bacterium]|nr:hypothetical protein [Devosiaceae bacterium]
MFKVFFSLINPLRINEIVVSKMSQGKLIHIRRRHWNQMLKEPRAYLLGWRKSLISFDFHIRQNSFSPEKAAQARDFAARSEQTLWHLEILLKEGEFRKQADREVVEGLCSNLNEVAAQLLDSANWLDKTLPKSSQGESKAQPE